MAGDVIHDTEHRCRRTSGPPLTVIKPTAMPGSPRGGHGAPPCDPPLLCPPPPPRGPPAAHATVDFALAPRFTFLVTLHPTRGHRSETRGRRPARGRLTWHLLCVLRRPPLRPALGSRFTLTCAAPLADEDTPFPDRTAPSPGADSRQRHGWCHDHALAPPAVRLRAARPAQGPPPRGPPPRGRHFGPLPARSHCFRQGPRPPAVGECRPVSSAFLLISRAKPTST